MLGVVFDCWSGILQQLLWAITLGGGLLRLGLRLVCMGATRWASPCLIAVRDGDTRHC